MKQLLPSLIVIPDDLAEQAVQRAQSTLAWMRDAPESRRDVITLVTRAGIRSFQRYFTDPSVDPENAGDVFGVAPRELVRSVSLQQTLQLIRISSSLVEEHLTDAAEREASVMYSRRLAFVAAELYANVGDGGGLWDHRLEQRVISAALAGVVAEDLRQRIVAVGWRGSGATVAAVGSVPSDSTGDGDGDDDRIRRLAWSAGADVLVGSAPGRIAVIASLVDGQAPAGLDAVIASIADGFGPGPIFVGPVTAGLADAGFSLRAAIAAAAAAGVLDGADRCVMADDLLPERALAGDPLARAALIERFYRPLADARGAIFATLRHYLDAGGAVEAAARQLDVHANTVRYRLKRVEDATGLDPTDARDAFVLQCALRLGLMAEVSSIR